MWLTNAKRPIMLNPQIFTSSPTSLKMYVALFQLILFDSVNFGDWERHVGVMKCTFKWMRWSVFVSVVILDY